MYRAPAWLPTYDTQICKGVDRRETSIRAIPNKRRYFSRPHPYVHHPGWMPGRCPIRVYRKRPRPGINQLGMATCYLPISRDKQLHAVLTSLSLSVMLVHHDAPVYMEPRCKRGGVTGVASKKVGVCDQSHTGVDQSAQTLMDLITAARRTSQYPLAVDMNIETNILCQLHLQQHTYSVGGYVL